MSEIQNGGGRLPLSSWEFRPSSDTLAGGKKTTVLFFNLSISHSNGLVFSMCSRGSGQASRHLPGRGARVPLAANPSRGSAGGPPACISVYPGRAPHSGFWFVLNRAPLLYRAPISQLLDCSALKPSFPPPHLCFYKGFSNCPFGHSL